MPEAFFEQDGDWFVPTESTRGPWDPGAQHAGPLAGLMGRAVEAHDDPGRPTQIGRITFDILKPVPIAPVRVKVETLRGGRSVELLSATLSDEENVLVRASAWRLRTTDVEIPDDLPRPVMPPPPGDSEEKDFFPTGQTVGYHTAMEYRFAEGAFLELGPAKAWMRMRHPLVAGETPSPLVRVLVAADTGNGISAAIDFSRYLFINVDLTVHLHRMPAGEWVCLDAITIAEPNGIGISDTALFDEQGSIGRAVQTLLVGER